MVRERYALGLSAKALGREFLDGFLSRWAGVRGSYFFRRIQDKGAVREFYQNARGNEDHFAIVDLSSSRYAVLWDAMLTSGVVKQRPALKILDIGCARFIALKRLLESGLDVSSYVGIDLVCERPPTIPGVEITTIENDIDAIEPSEIGEINVIICSNFFCYLSELSGVLDLLQFVSCDGAQLIIFEPRQSLLWESHFNGVRIAFRSPRELSRQLERRSWMRAWSATLYARQVKGLYIAPLADMHVFNFAR